MSTVFLFKKTPKVFVYFYYLSCHPFLILCFCLLGGCNERGNWGGVVHVIVKNKLRTIIF